MKVYQWSIIYFIVWMAFFIPTEASAKTEEAIIQYKDDIGLAHIKAQHIELLAHYEALQMIDGTFNEQQLDALSNDTHIHIIETKKAVLTPLTDSVINDVQTITPPWHVTMMQQPTVGYYGDGIRIGMLDTGVTNQQGLERIERLTLVDDAANRDINMHGTMVATVLASKNIRSLGLVPNSDVYSIKIFDETNEADISTFLAGINIAIERKVDVLNMSLGTTKDFPLLHEAIKTATNKGIVLVASVGNDGGKKAITYPAAYDEVIAVGAINDEKKRATFSNVGSQLEFVAPGEKISGLDGHYYSGTSFAAPHVTALIGSLKQQFPTWTATQLREYVRNYAEDLGDAGRDTQFGYGAISYELQRPATVSTLKKKSVSTSQIKLQFSMAKQTTVPVLKYEIYVNGKRSATTKKTTYTLKNLKANTTYEIAVRPISTAGVRAKKFRTIAVKTAKKSVSAQFIDRHEQTVHELLNNLTKADIRNDYATLYSISDALSLTKKRTINAAAKRKKAVVLSKHKPKATFVKTTNLAHMKTKKYSDMTFQKGIRAIKSSSYQLKRSGQKVIGYEVKKVNQKTLRIKLPKNAKSGRYAFVLKRDNVKTSANKTLEKHMIMYFDV